MEYQQVRQQGPIGAAERAPSGRARCAPGRCFASDRSSCDSRATWVSTVTPSLMPKALPSMTLAVFRPTPGRTLSASIESGTWPPWRSTTAFAMPMRLFVLLRKKPVDRMISSTSSGRAIESDFGIGIAPEEVRRNQVDPRVGALGRQDRGTQEFERVVMIELAVRVGIALLQPTEDLLRAGLQRGLRFPSARSGRRHQAPPRANARKSSSLRALRTSSGPSPPFRAMPTPYST